MIYGKTSQEVNKECQERVLGADNTLVANRMGSFNVDAQQSGHRSNSPLVSTQLASTSFATASDFETWRRIPTETALAILQERGGHPGALAEAALLCIKKSQDYNPGQTDAHNVDRTSYFPFGATSYAQMLHTKSNRFISIVQKQRAGDGANFESLRDTALDIINYAGFYLADPRTPK